MAGHGSGAGRAGGSGRDTPARDAAPAAGHSAAPPDSAAPGNSAGPADVPAQTLRSWDAAEAGLFPLIMARPHEYERSLTVVQMLLGWLRDNCADIPALLGQSSRGEALAAEAGHESLAGLRLDLIAAAACAMRYRELITARAASRRLEAFAGAREGGGSWAVIEETGDESRAPFLPYQRVEAHVPSGRALIISIEPDETLSAVRRIDQASLDLASGRLVIGAEIGSYAGAQEFDIALASARLRLG